MKCALAGMAILSTLVGCASTPPMTYKYYPSMALTTVSISQTISCNVAKDDFTIVNTPTIVTAYASDRDSQPIEFDASPLKSSFADGDLTFSWFDDGRLKSVGQASTGQGESVIKSAFTLLSAFGVGGSTEKSAAKASICTSVPDLNSGKSVTLVYEAKVDFAPSKAETLAPVPLKKGYEALHGKFAGAALPPIQVKASKLVDIPSLVTENSPRSSDAVALKLQGSARGTVSLLVSGAEIATSAVLVPTKTEVSLPILKPALFGKQAFSVALNEAGVITSVTYNSTSGTAGALNSLNAAQSTFAPSDSAKVAALKSEADLIAQTARLAKCQASPTTCQ